jgi:SAM-dependent methyltransferase
MRCRHCGSELEITLLDLGSAPPSNAYLTAQTLLAPELWLPLRLRVCDTCWLVQTEDYAKPDALFAADYAYFSSFSSSWLAHCQRFVEAIIPRLNLSTSSRVCEIAANDGYLLQYFQRADIPCYGIEPTAGTAAVARDRGIAMIEAFFGLELADRRVGVGQSGDLLIANNVLAHVPDINDFVGGFARLLKPSGVASFEFPHLLRMLEDSQFDTAYHEHYSYLSLISVTRIFARNGLMVCDVEEWPTHGGSLRVLAQRSDTRTHAVTAAVTAMLKREAAAGVASQSFYNGFQGRAETIKNDILAFLIYARRGGHSVAAYGAAAKGNTLLNFAGVRPDLLPYVVDRNPAKQGRFLPGSRIPVVAEPRLEIDRPDYILILPWNLRDEVIQQLAYARDWGAKFVTAIPGLSVI